MRIGFFTETYLPSTDGVVFSIELFRQELEKLGHEVFIFAPKPNFRYIETSPYVIRFPAVKSLVDNRMAGVFFPPQAVKEVEELELDIIHFHFPGPIGLLGAYVATKNDIPLVSTWHTDIYEYVTHYPSTFPGIMMLSLVAPLAINGNIQDFQTAISMIKPERTIDAWNKKMVTSMMTVVHNRCDLLIAPSVKIRNQLKTWGSDTPIEVLATGVDQIEAESEEITQLRTKLELEPDQPVVLFVGRIASEKNLDLLLQTFPLVLKKIPNTKLVLVGDHKRKPQFVKIARSLGIADSVIFAGQVPRDELGPYYAIASVFAFPSVTDTQALVLNEAAHAGLPVVMIDRNITDVVVNGESGLFARPSKRDFSRKILDILTNEQLQKQLGAGGRKLARRYTASKQAQKLLSLYQDVSKRHQRESAGKKKTQP